jgi:uncharacterized protein (TIGR02145 family)
MIAPLSKKYFLHSIIILFLCSFLFSFSSCDKNKTVTPEIETGSVMDIDSNIYKTVKIGNQWWMAENLKVTKYRNGTSIQQNQSNNVWQNLSSSYCIYDNNPQAPGLLYNYYAVTDTNILAPAGWHIPSDDEWKQLEIYLGMTAETANKVNWRGYNEGDKLKIEGPNGWSEFDNIWGTNESGFTALAGGCRLYNGVWGDPALFASGFWWTSSLNQDQAWYRNLDYKKSNIFRFYGSKNYGFSIRCVKD